MIKIKFDNCVGCNSCIRACPVTEANIAKFDAEGRHIIEINNERCLKCGECIHACAHEARYFTDDTDLFIKDIKSGVGISVIVAPAVKVAFDGNWRHSIGYLRDLGVKGIYDVSYGADICTWAHVRFLEKNPKANIISQPCAAIVNYITHYKPELIKNLSPIHSPMLCTVIWLKKYLGIKDKIAAISPCVAKKQEFVDTGLVDYNVTMQGFRDYLVKNEVKLPEGFSKFEFDKNKGWEGAIYPRPGGLKDNLLIHIPGLKVINSEGAGKVYDNFNSYVTSEPRNLPTVFDVLNCENGCNGGPAIGQAFDCFKMGDVMFAVETFTRGARKKNTTPAKRKKPKIDLQFAGFDQSFKLDDFKRTYTASVNNLRKVNEAEIEKIFQRLGKVTDKEKNFDCHACGFESCTDMATAIARELNVPDNCSRYVLDKVKHESEKLAQVNIGVKGLTDELEKSFSLLFDSVKEVKEQAVDIEALGSSSNDDMETIASKMEDLKALESQIQKSISAINSNAEKYKKVTTDVGKIAKKINMLSLNATIEAARAGEAGRGFAVVASNIRSLSDESQVSVDGAKDNDKEIKASMVQMNGVINDLNKYIIELADASNHTKSLVRDTMHNSQEIVRNIDSVDKMSHDMLIAIQELKSYLTQE